MGCKTLLADLRIRRSAPIHLNYQIEKGIEDLIAAGRLKPGTRLPSVQELAQICGVSLNTAKFAIRELSREGILLARPGLGTYVAERRPSTTEIFICDNQPEPGSSAWAFHRQITEGLISGYSDESRRLLTIYPEGDFLHVDEILASARARNVDCIMAYRPRPGFSKALGAAADEITCISLANPVQGAFIHSVVINPEKPIRKMLERRLKSGKRSFAFLSLDI